jgi:hypothetical protein
VLGHKPAIPAGEFIMSEFAVFLISAASLAFDPIALLAYVPAGVFIRKRSLAVAVGFLWMLVLQLISVHLWTRPAFAPAHLNHLMAALVLAPLVTGSIHILASRYRLRRQPTLLASTRSLFGFRLEWPWRVFLILQLVGVISLVYMAITSKEWAVFPYTPRGEYGRVVPPTAAVLTPYLCMRYPSSPIERWRYVDDRWRYEATWRPYVQYYDRNHDISWDFLDAAYWSSSRQNWIMLLALLGPFALSRGVAWIVAGTQKKTAALPHHYDQGRTDS